jgi:hypothetical protein
MRGGDFADSMFELGSDAQKHAEIEVPTYPANHRFPLVEGLPCLPKSAANGLGAAQTFGCDTERASSPSRLRRWSASVPARRGAS